METLDIIHTANHPAPARGVEWLHDVWSAIACHKGNAGTRVVSVDDGVSGNWEPGSNEQLVHDALVQREQQTYRRVQHHFVVEGHRARTATSQDHEVGAEGLEIGAETLGRLTPNVVIHDAANAQATRTQPRRRRGATASRSAPPARDPPRAPSPCLPSPIGSGAESPPSATSAACVLASDPHLSPSIES